MSRLYYVDPGDTTAITGPFAVGQTNVLLPNGTTIARLFGPVVSQNVYEAIEDNTETPQFNTLDNVLLQFEGTIGMESARVRETRQFKRISIEELYLNRKAELVVRLQQAYDQGINVTLNAGVIPVRSDTDEYVDYLGLDKSTLPGATQVTRVDVFGRFYTSTKAEVPAIVTQISVFNRAVANANFQTHDNAMIALRDAPNWEGLRDYDFSGGWPTPPTPPS